MDSAMEIRKCREEDIARTGVFYDNVVKWLDGHVNYPRWICGIYPSEDTVRAMTEAGAQYICTQDGDVVGAFGLDDRPPDCFANGSWQRDLPDGSYMILHALAVDPAFQRRGAASEIVRFCTDRAKSEGYRAMRVDIIPDNVPARTLVEKHGFVYAGNVASGLEFAGIPEFSLYELNW